MSVPTILLVDDNKVTLALEKEHLEARSFHVIATLDFREVLGLARSIRPDLIILDYDLGGTTGDAVCRQIRREPTTRDTRILILTAHDHEEVRHRCRLAGADALVIRSAGREALVDRVAELLGLPRRRHVRMRCQIRVQMEAGTRPTEGTAHNISESGAYLITRETITTGTRVRLGFSLPNRDHLLSARAEVVRAENLDGGLQGYGVQFSGLGPDQKALLREFVS